jgi:hypothetical protein
VAASANIGDQIKITSTSQIVATSTNTDPAVVKGWTRDPGGTVTTYTYGTDSEIAKTATGIYTLTFDVDTAGKWYAGFYSTGTGKGASDDVQIIVKSSMRSAT